MADAKISALPAVSAVVSSHEFAVNESGTSKKASAEQIKIYVDPWTYLVLTSTFWTSSSTFQNVTGLGFTPVSSRLYQIEGVFQVRTSTTASTPRLALRWPSNSLDGSAMITVAQAANSIVTGCGNIASTVVSPVGSLPNTTQYWPAQLQAMYLGASSVASTFQIGLQSEVSSRVAISASSFIRYRFYG